MLVVMWLMLCSWFFVFLWMRVMVLEEKSLCFELVCFRWCLMYLVVLFGVVLLSERCVWMWD